MARDIGTDTFTDADRAAFGARLVRELEALRAVLARPGFGEGDVSLGAEMELNIATREGCRPAPVNRAILDACGDPHMVVELNRFNLEYNCPPLPARGAPFTAMAAQLAGALDRLAPHAAVHGARIVPVGILPTLVADDLQHGALTDLPRYRALSRGMRAWRGAPFAVRIAGPDPLEMACDDITLEGANTSFQVHLRVPPRAWADTYDAAQLVTPLAVAIAANSPVFCGHRLWDETRIALFKQSLDVRDDGDVERRAPSRVGFGHGWVREGAWELFAEAAALWAPIFPVVEDEPDPCAVVADGGVPALRALRLHQGTVWRWNRAIYDPHGDGHLRIELRALPAGPTPLDMAANAALLVGLVLAFRDRMPALRPRLPFAACEHAFYAAARRGLDAVLPWPADAAPSPTHRPVAELLAAHLDDAHAELLTIGVDDAEATRLLGVIRERLRARTSGARWFRARLRGARPAHRHDAIAEATCAYADLADTRRPVHEWPVA